MCDLEFQWNCNKEGVVTKLICNNSEKNCAETSICDEAGKIRCSDLAKKCIIERCSQIYECIERDHSQTTLSK